MDPKKPACNRESVVPPETVNPMQMTKEAVSHIGSLGDTNTSQTKLDRIKLSWWLENYSTIEPPSQQSSLPSSNPQSLKSAAMPQSESDCMILTSSTTSGPGTLDEGRIEKAHENFLANYGSHHLDFPWPPEAIATQNTDQSQGQPQNQTSESRPEQSASPRHRTRLDEFISQDPYMAKLMQLLDCPYVEEEEEEELTARAGTDSVFRGYLGYMINKENRLLGGCALSTRLAAGVLDIEDNAVFGIALDNGIARVYVMVNFDTRGDCMLLVDEYYLKDLKRFKECW
ncbi:hypothetical protein M426DRAFT_264695 [Hypoxylon sp. CI-4A]|nr:hypothetical protein M426DRAFT_264695 [Hypoxylon sp. CI-4A]